MVQILVFRTEIGEEGEGKVKFLLLLNPVHFFLLLWLGEPVQKHFRLRMEHEKFVFNQLDRSLAVSIEVKEVRKFSLVEL